MDERLKKLVEGVVERNPELVAKFGNPLDESDPRNWPPSKRAEEGLSLEEQLRLLGLDYEGQALAVAQLVERSVSFEMQLDKLQKWAAEKMADDFIALAKSDPDKATEKLKEMLGGLEGPGSYGPLSNDPDSPIRYAGSTEGAHKEQMIETPQGLIRMQDIPGYRDDPDWRPSPDWVDANCMCEKHQAIRKSASNDDGSFGGTGLYL